MDKAECAGYTVFRNVMRKSVQIERGTGGADRYLQVSQHTATAH